MRKLYVSFCCLSFFAAFLYLVAFLGDFRAVKTVNTGPPAGSPVPNLVVLAIFGLQHSGMARPSFKRRWTRLVPDSIERPTYVLFSSLALGLLYWQWRPLPAIVWSIDPPASWLVRALFWGGWGFMAYATARIGGAELIGARGAGQPDRFRTPGPYRYVRHPIMLGLLAAFWAAPSMTRGHLLFSAVMTIYIVLAVQWEERDLLRTHGEEYRVYRSRVAMLLPRLRR